MSEPPPTDPGGTPPPRPRYTLGTLILVLDGADQHRALAPARFQERARRDHLWAHIAQVYESAPGWRPDEASMPGISRIELLCDLEPGEAGINAAKVRGLRARICRQQCWQIQQADQLTLDEAADLLEGIRRTTVDELQQAGRDQLHNGLATLDTIGIGIGQEVQVTGLSCKIIAGTNPSACPDASPALPPPLLPTAERAVRRLYPLPAGTTIHWVGHDTGFRNRCRCHPDAPYAAPFDQGRWDGVVSAPVSVDPTPPPAEPRLRLLFDDSTRIVTLDGVGDEDPLTPETYQFLKAIGSGERCGTMVPGREISGPGLVGKKLCRVIEKLPPRWKRLVTSQRGAGGGYCLTLPPKSCP